MNAREFIEHVSPSDKFGVRKSLKKKNLFNIVCTLMEQYARYRIEILNGDIKKE